MMDIADFDVGSDPSAPEKIIGTFFTSPRAYYRLQPRPRDDFERQFEVDVLDEEIKALYGLIRFKDKKFDDRRFAIEVQFSGDIELNQKRPILIILPETYLSNAAYIKKIESYGARIETYAVYPLRKEYFYYSIYEKLEKFYSENRYFNV